MPAVARHVGVNAVQLAAARVEPIVSDLVGGLFRAAGDAIAGAGKGKRR